MAPPIVSSSGAMRPRRGTFQTTVLTDSGNTLLLAVPVDKQATILYLKYSSAGADLITGAVRWGTTGSLFLTSYMKQGANVDCNLVQAECVGLKGVSFYGNLSAAGQVAVTIDYILS